MIVPFLLLEDGETEYSFGCCDSASSSTDCCNNYDVYTACVATGTSNCVWHDELGETIYYKFDGIELAGFNFWNFYVYFYYYDGTDDYVTKQMYDGGAYYYEKYIDVIIPCMDGTFTDQGFLEPL